MSVKVMSWVWDHSRAKGNDRLVLLAIADSAGHDGRDAWPSVATLAEKCQVSERTVQRSIKALAKLGELVIHVQAGGDERVRSDRRPNRYTVVMHGVANSRPAENGVTEEAGRGVDLSEAGRQSVQDGVTPVTPKPSSEPSSEPSSTRGDDVAETEVSDDVLRLCGLLADLMVENGCRRPSVTKTGWLEPMRLLIEKDGIEPDRVERAIRWCQRDEFWRANILSPKKLREKFDTLRLARQRELQRPGTVGNIQDAGSDYLSRRTG